MPNLKSSLQYRVRGLFNLHGFPALLVRWAQTAGVENRWPHETMLDEHNVLAILELIAARGSRDIIEAPLELDYYGMDT